jgi:hypothetical protein
VKKVASGLLGSTTSLLSCLIKPNSLSLLRASAASSISTPNAPATPLRATLRGECLMNSSALHSRSLSLRRPSSKTRSFPRGNGNQVHP